MRILPLVSLLLPPLSFAAEPSHADLLKKLDAEATLDGSIRVRFASDSFFEPGKPDLSPSSKAAMDDLLALVRLYPECRIRIESHTDSRGTKAFNAKLSQARAERMRKTLEGRGLNNVYEARSWGETRPLTKEDSDAARAKNRRIEVYVIPREPPKATP